MSKADVRFIVVVMLALAYVLLLAWFGPFRV